MKKIIYLGLMSLFLLSIAVNLTSAFMVFTETHGYPPNTPDTQSTKTGMKVQIDLNMTITNFTIDGVNTATKCYIQSNYAGTITYFSGNIVSNVCRNIFFNATAGTTYYFLVDKAGGSYTDSYNTSVSPNFPKSTGNMTWLDGIYQGGGEIGSQTYSIDSISYEFIVPPSDIPVITINYPNNGTNITSNGTVNFNFTILDNDSNIVRAYLYSNSTGNLDLNATNQTAITNFTFWRPSLTFNQNGTYEFLISAIDNNGLIDNKTGYFNIRVFPPQNTSPFSVDFSTSINQILVILFFIFCIFMWIIGFNLIGGVGLMILGFLFLTGNNSQIISILIITGGIILILTPRNKKEV